MGIEQSPLMWKAFSDNLPGYATLYIRTNRIARELKQLKAELARIEAAPTVPPADEIDEMERVIAERIDAAELLTAQMICETYPLAADFLERWRANTPVLQHGLARSLFTAASFADEVRTLPHVQRLHDLDLCRTFAAGMVAQQRARMANGELEDVHIPPQEKARRIERLKEQIAKLEAERYAGSPEWRHQMNGYRNEKVDRIKDMIEEYLEYQDRCLPGFFIEVLHRQLVPPDGRLMIDNYEVPKCQMLDRDRIKAVKALQQYQAELQEEKKSKAA